MKFVVTAVLILAIASLCLAGQVQKTVFDQCTPVVEGVPTICAKATSVGCFEFHARVTVNGQPYLDQDIPIPRMIHSVKELLEHPPPGTPKNVACYNYSAGALGHLGVCVNVTEMNINGDDLKFCGALLFSLDSAVLGKFSESLPVPCIDIQECKLFGCPNNCNGKGTCGTLGCECNKGYNGPDCSIFFNGSCVETDLVPPTCWKAFFPNCRTVEFEVTGQGGNEIFKFSEDLSNFTSVKLMPSTPLPGFEPCRVDVVAQNLSVISDTLHGCPTIQVTCDTLTVEEFPLDCMAIAQSPALICSNNPPSTPPISNGPNSPSPVGAARVAMYIGVGLLVIALLGGGGYFIFVRFIRKSSGTTYGYDAVSVNGGDDDDEGPLRSPFGGSSDEEQ